MQKHLNLLSLLLLAFTASTFAQESTNPIDTLANYVQKMNATVTTLSKLKISGYIQFQAQKADSLGIKSMAGGNFGANQNNRFGVRRGRIKFAYAGKLSNYVVQFDITEKGFATKDVYANFTDPWMQAFTVQGGVFNRPFGYEIPFSSSQRESPERSRFTQTLFPQERDLGAMLTFQMPKTSPWNFLKIDAGYFAGNGIGQEFDNKKDFIGRIGILKVTPNEKVRYGLGFSYYNGGVYQASVNSYKMWESNGIKCFYLDGTQNAKGAFAKRQYKGFDAQVSLESPIGITTLRGEYVMGVQPGQSGSSTSPNSGTTDFTTTGYDTYIRNFNGGYFYFVQSISHTPLTVILKYDFYDPNTKISGNDIGKASTTESAINAKATNASDLKYTTVGLGLLYAVSTNVKFTCYYDMVKNETSNNLKNYKNDLSDNVWTIRMQYKF